MTAFEQWANYFRENYRAFNPDEHDIAELAFDAALEHAAKICEMFNSEPVSHAAVAAEIREEISK